MSDLRLDLSPTQAAFSRLMSGWLADQGYISICRHCGTISRTKTTRWLELSQRRALASGLSSEDQSPRRRTAWWFCSATTILELIRQTSSCSCDWDLEDEDDSGPHLRIVDLHGRATPGRPNR